MAGTPPGRRSAERCSIMKKWIWIWAAAALVGCGRHLERVGSVDIVPEPSDVRVGEGVFSLTRRTEIRLSDGDSSLARAAGFFGELAGKKLVCLAGRFHSYEGYDFEQLTQPVRLLKLLGVRALIVTNAAGGVNLAYHRGDFMLIADHIKLNGSSPMRGRNVDEFGPRFFDVTRMYTPELRELAKSCAAKLGFSVHEGVYFFMPGPQFETPAEIRAIRLLGGDAVGMSTVTEALTAAHCGLPLLGISVITNMAAGITGEAVSGEEVNETGAAVAERFSRYLEKILEEMDV